MTDALEDLRTMLLAGPDLHSEDERERWEIQDDDAAGWALRKAAAAQAEIDRITRCEVAETTRVKEWADDARRTPQHDLRFFEGKLIQYLRSLEATNPKMAQTYKLPHGSIARRKGSESVQIEKPDEFTSWALDNAPDALTYTPSKSTLKTWVRKDDGTIVSPDGEAVPGVAVVRGEDRYEVRPAAPSAVDDLEPF